MKNASQFDPDDPRLTAYALGELDGSDLVELERIVAADPRAAAFVEELRVTASAVEHDYASEVASSSAAITTATRSTRAHPVQRSQSIRPLLQAAGIAALLVGAAFLVTKSANFSRQAPESGSMVAKRGPAVAMPVSAAQLRSGDSNYPQNPNVALVQSTTPSEEAAKFKREAIDNDSVEVTSIGVAHSGTFQGRGAPFAARRVGGAKKAQASPDVYYDSGETGDFRATTKNFFGKEATDGSNTEGYNPIVENAFKLATQDPLSTFSIDVDTASYANLRRFLNDGHLPPTDAVRVEELINYFHYAYPAPEGNAPFSTSATVASCPWAPTHKLVQVGLRARDIDMSKRLPSNLVFLVDVSGSMNEPDKLPLLKRSMRLLVDQLDARDRIAIVVYAGASGLALPSTSCASKAVIENAIDSLQPGGSTNGAAGIQLAYEIAVHERISEGQNRVILCTDGDFNVGVTDQGSLVQLIEEKRKSNVFLSVLGFGRGNVKDSTMEMLADKGNGNYAYIDSLNESRKVLVSEMGGTLFTVAKDVKIQVEFNPTRVQAWRLIGYENRQLAHQDFNDDKKDAGDIGASHNVTAFYEIIPIGARADVPSVDPLKYQQPTATTSAAYTDELLTLKLRYKAPDSDTSQLLTTTVADTNQSWTDAPSDFRFAASVAAFGMVLRHSPNAGSYNLQNVIDLAVPEIGDDVSGYRREFVDLVRKAQAIEGKPKVR